MEQTMTPRSSMSPGNLCTATHRAGTCLACQHTPQKSIPTQIRQLILCINSVKR